MVHQAEFLLVLLSISLAHAWFYIDEPIENIQSPWNVAIYKNKIWKCSGTLLNQGLILTAAHCITDTNGKLLDTENHTVAAGNLYKQFNDSNEVGNVQFSTVEEMFIPRQYKGEIQNYFGDIAILVTRNSFKQSDNVQPVLLNTNQTLTSNTNGSVSSWNFIRKTTTHLNILEKTDVSTLSSKQCERYADDDFKEYLTDDKFCAKYLNQESLCKGSSGEGLIVESENKLYLVGIASISLLPPSDQHLCHNEPISLYTDVSYYFRSFIKSKLAEYSS